MYQAIYISTYNYVISNAFDNIAMPFTTEDGKPPAAMHGYFSFARGRGG